VDERAELVEETIWEAFAAYRASPAATVVDSKTLRLGITGVPYAGLNGVFRARDLNAADVEDTLQQFRERGVSMLWHVGPQSDGGLEPLLLSAGLEFEEEEPGMVMRLDAPGEPPAVPDGLRIEPVREVETLRRWVDILSGGRLPESGVALRAALGLDAAAACQHLLGFLGDEAVATAAVYHGTRASEIQHVVTLDRYRRRGIGAAITAAALELALERGQSHAVLTASPDGEAIYRRLGFVTVCSVRRFLQRRRP
jgi:ribosomal protein S18 acetylase RimI-like enzyme